MWSPWPSLRQLLPVCDDPEFLWEVLPVRARVWVPPFWFTCCALLRCMLLSLHKQKHMKNHALPCGGKRKQFAIATFSTEALSSFKAPLPDQSRTKKQNVKRSCSSQRRDCPLEGISGCLLNTELHSQWGICCNSSDTELCFPKWLHDEGMYLERL